MSAAQPSILANPPAVGRSLSFRILPEADPRPALTRLRDAFALDEGVVGIGGPLAGALGRSIAGLRTFPGLAGPAGAVPSTQQALWIFLRGTDRTATFDRSARLVPLLENALVLEDAIDTFTYSGGKDLTGYVDGTANPQDDIAAAVALVASGAGRAGSSFVAVQRWAHDLRRFGSFSGARQDAIIGRSRETNDELSDAPESAHVKRAAQETFDPAAFMVRRSMPWATAHEQGLEFIAYGDSLDRFERVLRRMVGLDDGLADGLFAFSRPIAGSYYWCPPAAGGRLDLSLLGL
jgi:putative iron-dependent peroxidase